MYLDANDHVHLAEVDWRTFARGEGAEVDEDLKAFAAYTPTFAVAPDGTVYFTPSGSPNLIARISPGLIYDPIAGSPRDAGYAGDGGPAAEARFDDVRGLLVASDGNLYISDRNNGRVRRIRNPEKCPSAGPRPWPAQRGMTNGASYGSVAPGTVFALFGVRLGPDDLVQAQLNAQGRLPTEIAGVSVLIDGVAAPLLFVSNRQLGGIVPFGTQVNWVIEANGAHTPTGAGPDLIVDTPWGRSDPQAISSFPSAPGVFTLNASVHGPAAALNEDGSLNSADNPASRGSIVTFWATGFGALDPTPADGETRFENLPQPILPVTVQLGYSDVQVLYAGQAPGLAAGVMQVNVRIPTTFAESGELRVHLLVGGQPNSAVPTIFVSP